MTRRATLTALAVIAVALLGIQLVPYGVDHPEVSQEPAWNTPETRALAVRAGCLDCHSNETVVPWYGRIAPVSWLVAEHVDEGRSKLNLSEMDRPQEEAHEAGEEVLEGEMPPAYYVALHPGARLTDAERRQLAAGLDATLGGEEDDEDDDHEEHEDEEHEDDDHEDDDDHS